jgi:hypothetical protein
MKRRDFIAFLAGAVAAWPLRLTNQGVRMQHRRFAALH